ncbi:MAG: A/G-specific adenine glycosylase [Aerococcaceae bacterium]|nr:A/G-specific adenine glycosylase [Aerococcaceae bacterium]
MKQHYFDWSPQKVRDFRQTLLAWYDATKRDLPWRKTTDPYHIWVSEIMLQQTQVATVIPYYLRFVDTLPTIEHLANADEQTLLNLWQGLGYYSRVRNMQVAAQQIMAHHQGKMPQTMTELKQLKGIGPYTAAAIGSIAFGLVEPAIDGNLLRVTARLFEIDADIAQPKSRKLFEDILYELIDPERPGDFNQALMDIGATVMTPANLNPEASPLKAFDASYQNGTAHLYPVKSKKIKQTHHQMLAYAIQNQNGAWLFKKHSEDELLTGLWHFPLIEQEMVLEDASKGELIEPLQQWLAQEIPLEAMMLERTGYVLNVSKPIKHVFSHRVWHVTVIPIQLHTAIELPPHCQWVNFAELSSLPISTLQQKLQKSIWEMIE